jgi:hypothetical protein
MVPSLLREPSHFGTGGYAQGKLLLEFVPLQYYATVSAIEVVPE